MRRVDRDILQSLTSAHMRRSDAEHLERYLRELQRASSLAEKQAERTHLARCAIRTDLPPIAYDGAPEAASVLYLTSNPSYGDEATPETHYQPHPDWPLSVVNPQIHPPTAQYYQRKVFSGLLKAGVTQAQISRRVLKVELSPWASKAWPKRAELAHALCRFPSHRHIVELVKSLVAQDVLVIIKSGEEHWLRSVPELHRLYGERVFKSKAPRFAWITPKTFPQGWAPLLRALRA